MARCVSMERERQAARTVARIADAMLERLRAGGRVPTEDFADAMEYLEGAARACEREREAPLTFPGMDDLPGAVEPLRRLTMEHLVERGYVDAIRDSMGRARKGSPGAAQETAEGIKGYAELLRRHLEVAEDQVFPIAREFLGLEPPEPEPGEDVRAEEAPPALRRLEERYLRR